MSDLSAKSFLGLLQKSGIVSEERLKQALGNLSKQAAGRPVMLDELTKFLLAADLITPWHYEKLITGKYKGFFIGQYKLLSLLGAGGMSSVYLAEHSLSGHRRAVKVLPRRKLADKSYLDRFYQEGRAAASLNHPNIVRIYDLCNEKDLHYMVMEYVIGVDLNQKIKDDGNATVDDALNYVRQSADALTHAHARNIVHRDIKPANLLLGADNSVKLLDLGLALLRDEVESLTVLHNERVMGTADYLSPEQAVNSHEVDHRADIYSLGCTLYYLLTGKPPFPEGTMAQRIAMHQTREPKPIAEIRPDVPPLVVSLLARMTKKKPQERFEDCAQLVQAVDQCRAANKISSAPKVASNRPVVAVKARAPGTANLRLPPTKPPETNSGGVKSGGVNSSPVKSGVEKPVAVAPAAVTAVVQRSVAAPIKPTAKPAESPARVAATQQTSKPAPEPVPKQVHSVPHPVAEKTRSATVSTAAAVDQGGVSLQHLENMPIQGSTKSISLPQGVETRLEQSSLLKTANLKSRHVAQKATFRTQIVVGSIVFIGFAVLLAIVIVIAQMLA